MQRRLNRMKIKKLTKKEQAWIDRAQRVFDAAPARFAFMTIGDHQFCVLDYEGSKVSELCDGAAHHDGLVLGRIDTQHPVPTGYEPPIAWLIQK